MKFWNKADSIGKKLRIIGFFILTLGLIGGTVYLGYSEYYVYDQMKRDVKSMESTRTSDSLRLDTLQSLYNNLHSLMLTQERSREETYAVGYRFDNTKQKRYYRDWKGEYHELFPDPDFSATTQKYYYVDRETGYRRYPFTD